MKEFVEKLIGRFEEEKEFYRKIRKNTHCRRTEMDDCDSCRADHYLNARLNCVDNLISIVNKLAEEYKDKVIIDGQYCWQTCACTEKCNECNRLTLTSSDIDWYENIEDWTEEYRPRTNADFIRKMNDEELAEFLYGVDHFVDDGQCIVCFEEIRLNDDKADILDWLQSEVKGSE